MSKSLKRVRQHAVALNLDIKIVEATADTKTAQQAADFLECQVNQIAKSIIFRGDTSGALVLFITAGGNRVSDAKATLLAGEALGKADAALIREQTGFAIGGVAPIGHLNTIRCFMDPTLLTFREIWAAAGTPRHLFSIAPDQLAIVTDAQSADFTL